MFRGIRYVIPNVACHPSRREVKEGSLEGNSGQTPFVGPGSFAVARGGFVVCGAGGLRGGGSGRFVRLGAPNAVLMKGPEVLQVREFYGGQWCHYQDTGWTCGIYDTLGTYYFPKADAVGAGTRLHVRLAKPEHPSTVAINACTKTKTMPGQPPMTGKFPAGQRQQLKHTFVGRVERDGETVGWNVFFRVNEPERQYYLVVQAAWEKVPGTHVSYGDADYPFHVKTR
jgi:hypothetical protein